MFFDPDDISNKDVFESIKEVASCDICTGIVWDAKQCSSCENTFCNNCISSWIKKSKTCPFKCEDFDIKDSTRIVRSMLSKLEFKCQICEKEVKYDDYAEHQKTCKPITYTTCPICGNEKVESSKVSNFKKGEDIQALETQKFELGLELKKLQNKSNVDNTYELELLKKENQRLINEIKSFQMIIDNFEELGKNNSQLNFLEGMAIRPRIVDFKFSGAYSFRGVVAGSNRIEDLNDRSLHNGICAKSPGWIIFQLNDVFELSAVDIGGFTKDPVLWAPSNGANAVILGSTDKNNWTEIGKLPSTFGPSIIRVNLTVAKVRYLKFDHHSYLGIGYLHLQEVNSNSFRKHGSSSWDQSTQFADVQISSPYIYNGKMAGNNSVKELTNPDLTKKGGICSNTPGEIKISLSKETTFNGLEVGGYCGDNILWYPENGAGAEISFSMNNIHFTKLGIVPRGFGTKIQKIEFAPVTAKFIRLHHSSYLGIGYLRLLETSNPIMEFDSYLNLEGSFKVDSQYIKIKDVTISKPYKHNVSNNTVEDLTDRDLNKGVCASSPGWIMVELENLSQIHSIEVGGYTGNMKMWHPTQGVNSEILVSIDKEEWIQVGNIPKTHGPSIISFDVIPIQCKFIKFVSKGYIGFGFLAIH